MAVVKQHSDEDFDFVAEASVLDEVLPRSNGGRPPALVARLVLMHQRTLSYICCSRSASASDEHK